MSVSRPVRPCAAERKPSAIGVRILRCLSAALALAGCATSGATLPNPAETASADQTGRDAGAIRCFICDAAIHADERLHVKLVYEGGAVRFVEDAREAARALKALADTGRPAPKVIVFDNATGEEVDAGSAFAVAGSTFTPARKFTSGGCVLFFKSRAGADDAVKSWGGKVVGFAEVIRAISPAQDDPPSPARRSSGSERGSGRSSGGSSGGGAGGGHHH